MDTQTIFIRGLRVDAQIGIHAHEKQCVQPLELDADIQVGAHRFRPTHDRIEEVFDYQTLRDAMLAVVHAGHTHLLETLADRIMHRILQLPDVQSVRLRISKFTAFDDCQAVGVEVFRTRTPS